MVQCSTYCSSIASTSTLSRGLSSLPFLIQTNHVHRATTATPAFASADAHALLLLLLFSALHWERTTMVDTRLATGPGLQVMVTISCMLLSLAGVAYFAVKLMTWDS